MVAGDFNAESSAWGSGTTDARGRAICETIDKLQLEVANEGNRATFHKEDSRESIVDIT